MSNSNGYQTLTKSMNGIITLSDGSGTIISDGTIQTVNLDVDNLNTQNITAPNLATASNVYNENTEDVNIGSNCNLLTFRKLYTTTSAGYQYLESNETSTPFAFMTNNSASITIGSNTSPIIGEYTCTSPTHLANKGYVDSVAGGGVSLSADNIWTGNNFFENIGKNTTSNNLRLGYNMGTGQQLFIGSATGEENVVIGIANQAITIGNGANRNAALNICNSNNCVSDIRIGSNTTFNGSIHLADTSTLAPHLYLGSAGGITDISGDLNINGPSLDVIMTTNFGVNAPDTQFFATSAIINTTPMYKIVSSSLSTGGCFSFDTSVAGTSTINFLTNVADKNIATAKIVASGGTNAGTGNLISYGAGHFFFNGAGTQSLRINPASTAGAVDVIFRCNTANSSQASITMRGDNSTATNNGTLTTYCGISAIRASTGNFCSIEQSVGTDTATLNFKSSTANNVVSSSIIATGGSSIANTGTLTISGSGLTVNSTTTTLPGTVNISGVTNITSSGQLIGACSSGNMLLFNGDSFQVIAASTFTLDPSTIPTGAMLAVNYASNNYFGITLSTTGIRDGQYFTIYNGGQNTIQILTLGNRLFGPGCTRGGQSSFNIISNDARRFRGCTFGTTSMLQGGTLGQGYFVEFIS